MTHASVFNGSSEVRLTGQLDGRVLVSLRCPGPARLEATSVLASELRAALDELDPAGSYTRTDEADWKARAEKAKEERDDLREQLEAQKPAVIREHRPLTAEAIESVLHDILPLTANRLGEDDIASIASDLYLALTAPARDPRAEEMQADLATAEEPEMDDEDRRLIADHLAALGYRKTGAES